MATRSVCRVIGDKIRAARLAAGFSQEDLAFRAKVSRNYISMVELGQASPTLDTLFRICHAAGVRAAKLVDEVEPTLRPLPVGASKPVKRPTKRRSPR